MSLTSRHPLRKSCSFCRARKIKCSNETICEACRKQNVDCVYDWDSRPPKTRTVSQDMSRNNSTGGDSTGVPVQQRQRASTGGSPHSTTIMEEPAQMEGTGGAAPVALMGGGEDVATMLNSMFIENFGENPTPGPKSNPWQERISAYNQTLRLTLQDRSENVVNSKFSHRDVKYTGILQLLTHDLVGLVVDKFGGLGSIFMEQGGGRFYLTGLASDATPSMFDTTPTGPSPLTDYGTRQIGQLVDVWYSVHPLSFLVSKTLLLRELRDGTHDEVLLAVILADASFSLGDEVAMARGHVLLRWASAQLQNRPISTRVSQPGMPGAGISLPGISTAQVLMLLGWNSLCQGQIKRATCYIGLSGRLATEIKDTISASSAPLTTSRINGIDVCEVEKEIVAYLYWTTYTLTLWTFLQMGTHFSQLLPTSLTSIFLPVDETSSVLMRLDEVSDNFSTLQKQKSMIKEMWPLAHIASITAYIFALYPQEPDPNETVSTNFWQEAPLLALQRIQQGSTPQDMECVCREVYRVLMESIHLLNRQVAHAPSRSLVLSVYHTMAIHLLFPAILPGAPPPAEPFSLTAETVERFIGSAQELVGIMLQIAEQTSQEGPVIMPAQSKNSFPDVFCLALDTCARGLSFIYAQKQAGVLNMEPQMIAVYEGRLEALASRLLGIAASDFLSPGGQVRAIKKHLKAVMRAFGGNVSRSSSKSNRNSTGSGMSIPISISHHTRSDSYASSSSTTTHSMSRRNSSLPHTPPQHHHDHPFSGAPTAVDSASSFISPMDTSMMPSVSSSSSADDSMTSTSELATPFNPFSPGDSHSHNKHQQQQQQHDWRAADELFAHVMDPAALGAPTGDHHLTLADLVDCQAGAAGWFPDHSGGQMLVDFDMGAAANWEWPSVNDMGGGGGGHDAGMTAAAAAVGSDMDAMFYNYFKK
ncbi:hypothetical protein CPAR01_15431 [Colletotrichum paranaense]|uniref:Zn(2)-C6 fungal-type domain-containing protein n=1 Tax=Colletotrichum paranaense TaxID=1914294 RepID=A0ABQ9RZ44_9PEZI|nr:uncharacterized protein CPAR01_15431 [Colletotrichum paranaense]KAK1519938.1 hypothetical protein CPAR01_15431 [Colletotrichum paranaense]